MIEVCDENCSYEVLANSFEELLSNYAQQLIAGEYQFNPEYEEVMLQTPKNKYTGVGNARLAGTLGLRENHHALIIL